MTGVNWPRACSPLPPVALLAEVRQHTSPVTKRSPVTSPVTKVHRSTKITGHQRSPVTKVHRSPQLHWWPKDHRKLHRWPNFTGDKTSPVTKLHRWLNFTGDFTGDQSLPVTSPVTKHFTGDQSTPVTKLHRYPKLHQWPKVHRWASLPRQYGTVVPACLKEVE